MSNILNLVIFGFFIIQRKTVPILGTTYHTLYVNDITV